MRGDQGDALAASSCVWGWGVDRAICGEGAMCDVEIFLIGKGNIFMES
jgi:hypothetical protein